MVEQQAMPYTDITAYTEQCEPTAATEPKGRIPVMPLKSPCSINTGERLPATHTTDALLSISQHVLPLLMPQHVLLKACLVRPNESLYRRPPVRLLFESCMKFETVRHQIHAHNNLFPATVHTRAECAIYKTLAPLA